MTMDERRNKITSKQLMIFIVSAQTGIGIMSISSRLAKIAGHDGWISALITGAASMVLAVIMVKLLKRYGNRSILDINILLYGKYLGTIINLFLILYVLYKEMLNVRMFSEVIKALILRLTPLTILTTFIFIPTVYLSWYGLKPICRFANHILVIIAAVLALFAIMMRFVNINFLLPVGNAGILSIISAMPILSYSALGFAIVSLIYPEVEDKKNVMKNTLGAIGITTAFYAIVIVVTTGFFGEVMTSRLTFPLFSIARAYKAPILERIDFYFLILWFPAMSMAASGYFFPAYYSINKLFRIRRKTLSLVMLTVAVILLSRIPKDLNQVFYFMDISNIVGIPLISIHILASYLFSFINKRGVQQK